MNRTVKVLFQTLLPAFVMMLTGVVCLGYPAQAASPSGIRLLQQMRHAAASTSYSARQTTWRKRTPVIITHIWDNGNQQRIKYLAPPVAKGDVQVDDGKHIWHYHRGENSVVQTPSASQRDFDIKKFTQKYNVKVLGTASIADRKAWIIGIWAKNGEHYLRKFWIDQRTHLRLRTEYFDAGGRRVEATQLGDLHYGAISNSHFEWKTPSGAKVNYAGELFSHIKRAQREASWLRLPYWLPAGYAFESAVVNKSNNEAWLRYSNGTRRFSIFEQRTKDQSSSEPIHVDGGWFWKQAGVRFLIAGVSESTVQKIASSF